MFASSARAALSALLLAWATLLHGQQTPFGGTPPALPGTIELEHYDQGGAGTAFHDLTPTNTGSPVSNLRGDAVDLATDAAASGGVLVQDAAVGEWLEYTVAPALSATRPFVNLTLRYRANYEKQLRLLQDGVTVASPVLPATSGTTWGSVTLEKVPFASSASSVLRLEVIDSGGNALLADKTAITATEQWDILDAGSTGGTTDSVNLRNVFTGKFLRLTSKDHQVFAGGTDPAATNARFILAQPAGAPVGTYSLQSRNTSPNNTFIGFTNTSGTAGAKATTDASNDQRFTLVDLGATPGATAGLFPIGRRVALVSVRTSANTPAATRHVSVANDAGLRLDSIAVAQWVNRTPVLDPLFNRTVTWPTSSLTLSGVCQELDPSGSITARAWTQVSGPASATLGTPTTTANSPSAGKETTSVAVSGLQRGIYVFRFSATDDMGDTTARDIEVAVIDPAQHTLVAPAAAETRFQYFGRTHNAGGNAPQFGWSGSGLRFRVQSPEGGTVSARLGAGGWPSGKQQFYLIRNEDRANPRIIDMNGSSAISHLATGLPAGEHRFELYALSGSWSAPTTFNGLLLGPGMTLLAAPARSERRMEFYGDSITEGGLMPDQPITNTHEAFAAQTARLLGAEAAIIARSGLGLVKTGYSGGSSLESLHARGLPWDSSSTWNFDLFKPQVVVVNILQNDKWQAGSSTDAEFITAYVRFLRLLRAQHPNAHIVCALGSMDATSPGANGRWTGIVTSSVNTLRTEDRDTKLHTVFFPYLGPDTGHPSAVQAGAMARQLADYLNGLAVDVWSDGREAPAGYQAWLGSQSFPLRHASEAQPGADADRDGRPNLLEYAFGTDPWSDAAPSATWPALGAAPAGGGALRLEFPRAAADLTYTVQWSASLAEASWQSAPWPLEDLGGGRAGVTVPAPTPARIFLRVSVEM